MSRKKNKQRRHASDPNAASRDSINAQTNVVEARAGQADSSSPDADRVDTELVPADPGVLSVDLVRQLEALKSTLVLCGTVAELAEHKTAGDFREFAESVGAEQIEQAGGTKFRVPLQHQRTADKFFRPVDKFKRGKDALANTFLIAIVAEFDVLFAGLLRWLWSQRPGLFDLDGKSVSMQEIRGASSVRAIEEALLEKEVDQMLRSSRSEQFGWLKQKLGTDFGTQGDLWTAFIEAHERRHLCVHTGGRVSSQYVSNCRRAGILDVPAVGTTIRTDPQYVQRVASTFSEMAVKTAQVIWRKIHPNPNEPADMALAEVSYSLIDDGKYRLAGELLRFGLYDVKKMSSDGHKKTWIINLAQTEKWQGRQSSVLELLGSEDWSSASAKYHLALHVLRDEHERAAELMRRIGSDGDVKHEDFVSWPLFREFRTTEEFKAAYEDVFGHPFVPRAEPANGLSVAIGSLKLERNNGTSPSSISG